MLYVLAALAFFCSFAIPEFSSLFVAIGWLILPTAVYFSYREVRDAIAVIRRK